MAKSRFIIVGENIHCTRIRLTTGKFVVPLPNGRHGLAFRHKGNPATLPIPEKIEAGEEWNNGKVRHVAVAVWQGLYGTAEDQATAVAYLQAMSCEQEATGAFFLDINVDEFSLDQDEKLRAIDWVVQTVQQTSAVPLSIDSSNADILKAGLEACDRSRGKAMINSVSLERTASIPVAAAAGAKIIASAAGATGMPETVAARLDNVAKLMVLLDEHGFAREDIYLDPLVFPISVDGANGPAMLDAIAALRQTYGPAIHFAPGISNISFGLPRRPLINQVFARLCRERGCDGGIVDPLQINDSTMDGLDPASEAFRLAEELLLGRDEYGMNYITASRDGTI